MEFLVGLVLAVVAFGFAALAVLALLVGLFDAAQAGQWREIARSRRDDWERRRDPIRDADS